MEDEYTTVDEDEEEENEILVDDKNFVYNEFGVQRLNKQNTTELRTGEVTSIKEHYVQTSVTRKMRNVSYVYLLLLSTANITSLDSRWMCKHID